MPIRVSPTEPHPTHDFSLRARDGTTLGLMMCDALGRHKLSHIRTPIERTALKTTSGNSQYSDLDYPYSPIVQADWSGGRGALDFESDGTRYADSYRLRTGRPEKAFLGPQEQYSSGIRTQDQLVPGNVKFISLTDEQRYLARRFEASASYTAALAWLISRRRGTPADLTIAIHSDNVGAVGGVLSSITVASTRMADILSEWLDEAVSQALVIATHYWLVIHAASTDDTTNHWELAVKPAAGTTYYSSTGAGGSWSAASFDLYMRLSAANVDKRCVLFDYKEQQYAILSPSTGAPKLYMNGDRGAADANAGQLNQLKDATKAWNTDQWVGCVVKITDGTGKAEFTVYRTVIANDATTLTMDSPWTITHDTTTEYVILGANIWREITGHGLTAPVTDVLVSTSGVLYVCMGDSVLVRRLRAYNDTGATTWRDFDDAANCQADEAAATKATFITYKPQAQKIVIGNNQDAGTPAVVSVRLMSNANVPDWGAALTWAAAVPIGNRYRKMTHLEVYPDDSGNEAVWVGKVDRPWIVPGTGNPYPLAIKEMEAVKSEENFNASVVHNVYLYFPLGNGLERYYAGQLDDVGPNLGEGLPANRQGALILFAGYPGKFFAAVDGGTAGYSSILVHDNNGWHEHYRAPKGQRIRGLSFQPIPGTALDRLWMYVGNDLLWLPFPSADTNELNDPNYLYTHEGALELARMHAGMFDVQKIVRILKLWTDQCEADVCWFEVDYRLDENSDYVPFELNFETSPESRVDLGPIYGLAAKRLQLRIRFYTADATQTPILLAVIIEAVMRIAIKYMYSLSFRLRDRERCLDRSYDDQPQAMAKLLTLDEWADSSSDTMLLMRSRSPLYDGRLVFLNPVQVQQTRLARPGNANTRNVFVCTTSVQEA